MVEQLVVDASAMVDYLVSSPLAASINARLDRSEVHVPAHFDAEVLSALGRLNRAGSLTGSEVEERIELTAAAPFHRHPLAPLLTGAWQMQHNVRLVDALYVQLATQLAATIVTTDAGLAAHIPEAHLIQD